MYTVFVTTYSSHEKRTDLAGLHRRLRNITHHVLLPMRELAPTIKTFPPSIVITNRCLLEFREWTQLPVRVSERAILSERT